MSSASASFVKTDITTQGNWNSAYGADGYNVSQDANTKIPSYAQVSFSNQSNYTWAGSTSDVRALKKPENLNDRIAGTWYTGGVSSYTIDVNITDGNSHQVALYALDWDSTGRAQTIRVLDAATGTVLDSQTLSAGSFHNGAYLVWNIKGHVKFEVDYNGGYNAVISGLFFGGAAVPAGPPVTLTAQADDWVQHSSPTLNRGTDTWLGVAYDERETYLRYDLASITGNVTSAHLRLTPAITGGGIASTTFQLQLVADDSWVEGNGGFDNNPVGEMNWNNKPAGSTILATWTGETAGVVRDVDITAAVQQQLASDPGKKLSLRLVSLTPGNGTSWVYYDSREDATPANRPQLVVQTG
ncbi:hypothetical protein AYO44_18020 [Planctomycetaceae bacterium SCGC AG-212-F19]|nr:hypothetical protein AYO44_18020 [Planctomycetaceae bacterium SCGC AG-212-F19]